MQLKLSMSYVQNLEVTEFRSESSNFINKFQSSILTISNFLQNRIEIDSSLAKSPENKSTKKWANSKIQYVVHSYSGIEGIEWH